MSDSRNSTPRADQPDAEAAERLNQRRAFLKFSGVGLAALAFGSLGASNVIAAPGNASKAQTQTINLGTGDTAVANFAYLLEQLEADFYTRVVANNFYSGANAEEIQILTDLRDHEIIHREFFKNVLGSSGIPTIPAFNFSLVNFNSRESVLTVSQILEDTGVSAYNGAGQILTSTDILVIAGKIVSVEARHAAAIRDLRIPRNGYASAHGEDFALDPVTVLNLAAPFLPAGLTIDASGLPRTVVV